MLQDAGAALTGAKRLCGGPSLEELSGGNWMARGADRRRQASIVPPSRRWVRPLPAV